MVASSGIQDARFVLFETRPGVNTYSGMQDGGTILTYWLNGRSNSSDDEKTTKFLDELNTERERIADSNMASAHQRTGESWESVTASRCSSARTLASKRSSMSLSQRASLADPGIDLKSMTRLKSLAQINEYNKRQRFQVMACLVMQFDDWCNVCPIHFYRLFLLSSSSGSWNATLALPILAFTSTSEPPCSLIMLPRYVKESTSSRVSPSRVIGLLFSALNLRTLVFPLCIMRPTDAETAFTLAVFVRICSCVYNKRARSSAKSKSSN
ncbi:unnamed protein product [Schistosoma margrebowiei]|uniref:Uncharacterized protein n=1 Tax=Schistosoma margrebowiei TaxID=48269 RepID=A0A183N8H9_9TREM|nr:unnamed protein product [Schistosoma margrebowiei]